MFLVKGFTVVLSRNSLPQVEVENEDAFCTLAVLRTIARQVEHREHEGQLTFGDDALHAHELAEQRGEQLARRHAVEAETGRTPKRFVQDQDRREKRPEAPSQGAGPAPIWAVKHQASWRFKRQSPDVVSPCKR